VRYRTKVISAFFGFAFARENYLWTVLCTVPKRPFKSIGVEITDPAICMENNNKRRRVATCSNLRGTSHANFGSSDELQADENNRSQTRGREKSAKQRSE
jgi:hypothetical protein